MDNQSEKSYVDRCTEQIEALLAKIAQLKQEAKSIKESIPDKVFEMLQNSPTPDEAAALAWEIYWNMDDVPTAPLNQFYNTTAKSVREIVGGAIIHIHCGECGIEFQRTFNSRNEYKEAAYSSWKKPLCNDCQQKDNDKKAERTAKWEQERAEQASRLLALKTMPYKDYLQTEHWKATRMAMLKRANFRCQLCNTQGQLHVHHRTYIRRGEENYGDLIVLCATCHQTFHDNLEVES